MDRAIATNIRATGDVRFRAIGVFLALAFGLAWGAVLLLVLFPEAVIRLTGEVSAANPLFILAVYSPAIAGLIVVGAATGLGGIGRFLGRLLLWRAHPGWYVALILGIPAVYVAGALLAQRPAGLVVPAGGLQGALAALAFMAVLGPVEEFGWRGVALPLLQRRMAPFHAAIVLGLIWGIWHLPAFFLSGTPQSNWDFLPFFAGTTAISVIATALFNRSGGSLMLPILLHFQLNGPFWPDGQPWDSAIFVGIAALVAWMFRDEMFRTGSGIAVVVPAAGPV